MRWETTLNVPTFYYDYYKIENFLRHFEREHNLTQLGFDETKFWSARNMEKNLSSPTTPTREQPNIGELLAKQVSSKSENLLQPEAQELKGARDVASWLHQEARHISSGEAVFDGLDLINLGMEVAAIALEILARENNERHEKQLALIVSLSNQLDKFESQVFWEQSLVEKEIVPLLNPIPPSATADDKNRESKSNTSNHQSMDKLSNQQIDSFIKNAINYLDQKTTKLEESLAIKSNDKKLDRSHLDYDKQLALIQKRLNVIDARLPKHSQKKSISAENLYTKILNYFHSVDEFTETAKKAKYRVSSQTCGSINLDSSENHQTLLLVKDDRIIYYAEKKNERWQEKENSLSSRQIEKLSRLPQSKEQVAEQYSTRYLANLLKDKLQESEQIEKTITWKFNDENGKISSYSFQVAQTSNQKQISILGKSENQANIFTAKIDSDGIVDVVKNQIPLKRISQLIELQNQSTENQKQTKSNPEKLVKNPKLPLKRSR